MAALPGRLRNSGERAFLRLILEDRASGIGLGSYATSAITVASGIFVTDEDRLLPRSYRGYRMG
jgi:hypothetical protein